MWVIATAAISFLAITARSTRAALLDLVGRDNGRVVCDRATAFNSWKGPVRQTCWAHLLRYFEAMAPRDGPSGRIGHQLCTLTFLMFSAWHDFKAGRIDRAGFQTALRQPRGDPQPIPFVEGFRTLIDEGRRCENPETAGTCRNLLKLHWDEMWTFVDVKGVEPTDNHAEQELRPAVLWRKRSFGTQSDRGDRLAERILTAARSLRKQSRHLHNFLVESLHAAWCGDAPPSLLPRDQPTP
ncbi:MAG: transposase [Myxococcota bacterium]